MPNHPFMNNSKPEKTSAQIEPVLRLLKSKPHAYLVALVGVPGSGKSTICDALATALPSAMVLPMDGYHLYRHQLAAEDIKRRGAPHTFALDKLRIDLQDLRRNRTGRFPAFDHALKDPVADSIYVTQDRAPIIIEGNYLLLENSGLSDLFDVTIMLDCDIEIAMARVRHRLFTCGIVNSLEEAADRVRTNDRLNAELVLANDLEKRVDLIVYQDECQFE